MRRASVLVLGFFLFVTLTVVFQNCSPPKGPNQLILGSEAPGTTNPTDPSMTCNALTLQTSLSPGDGSEIGTGDQTIDVNMPFGATGIISVSRLSGTGTVSASGSSVLMTGLQANTSISIRVRVTYPGCTAITKEATYSVAPPPPPPSSSTTFNGTGRISVVKPCYTMFQDQGSGIYFPCNTHVTWTTTNVAAARLEADIGGNTFSVSNRNGTNVLVSGIDRPTVLKLYAYDTMGNRGPKLDEFEVLPQLFSNGERDLTLVSCFLSGGATTCQGTGAYRGRNLSTTAQHYLQLYFNKRNSSGTITMSERVACVNADGTVRNITSDTYRILNANETFEFVLYPAPDCVQLTESDKSLYPVLVKNDYKAYVAPTTPSAKIVAKDCTYLPGHNNCSTTIKYHTRGRANSRNLHLYAVIYDRNMSPPNYDRVAYVGCGVTNDSQIVNTWAYWISDNKYFEWVIYESNNCDMLGEADIANHRNGTNYTFLSGNFVNRPAGMGGADNDNLP